MAARVLFFVGMLFISVVGASSQARSPQFEQLMTDMRLKISKTDPKAAEAALALSNVENTKAQFEQIIPKLVPQVTKLAKSRNPGLDEATANAFGEVFFRAVLIDVSDFTSLWEQATNLEIFTHDEMLAAVAFKRSAIGVSMTSKRPNMLGRIPEILSFVQQQSGPNSVSQSDFSARISKEHAKYSTELVEKAKNSVIMQQLAITSVPTAPAIFRPMIEDLMTIQFLETYSKEEIEAYDHEIRTPLGASAMQKMPRVLAKLPDFLNVFQTVIIPSGVAAAQAKLKALGKEIKI